MIKALAVASMVLVSAPVLAQESDDSGLPRLDEFVAVFQAHNCVLATKGEGALAQDELFGLFADVGFSRADVPVYASTLIRSGRAVADDATDGVTVLPPLCTQEASE